MLRYAWALTILPICAPAADPTAWGPSANGLRIALSITQPASEPIIRLTLENVGEGPILVRLGDGSRERLDILNLRGFLTDKDGTTRQFVYGSGTYMVPGNIIPFVIPLHALTIPLRTESRYEFDAPVNRWTLLLGQSVESLPKRLASASQMWIEVQAGDCFAPHDRRLLRDWHDPFFAEQMRSAQDWPCWQGKLTSNVLRLKQ